MSSTPKTQKRRRSSGSTKSKKPRKQTSFEDLQKMNVISHFDEYGFAVFEKHKPDSERCHEYRAGTDIGDAEYWSKLLADWDKECTHSSRKLHNAIKRGVPPAARGDLWKRLLDTDALKASSGFNYKAQMVALREQLVDLGISEYTGRDSVCHLAEEDDINTRDHGHINVDYIRQIMLDVDRSYPTHKMLMGNEGKEGRAALFRLLATYVRFNPKVGYCQGMSYLAGMFLMQVGEEDAFWCTVAILERHKYFQGYYDVAMERIQSHSAVFKCLMLENLPAVHEKLEVLGVDTPMFVISWFLCLFTSLPCWDTVLAIWDLVLLNGIRTMFQVGIALLSVMEDDILGGCDIAMLLPKLLHPPPEKAQYDVLMPVIWCTVIDDWQIDTLLQVLHECGGNEHLARRKRLHRDTAPLPVTAQVKKPRTDMQEAPSLFKRFVNIFTPREDQPLRGQQGHTRKVTAKSGTKRKTPPMKDGLPATKQARTPMGSLDPNTGLVRRSARKTASYTPACDSISSCELAMELSFVSSAGTTPHPLRRSPRLKALNTPTGRTMNSSCAKTRFAFHRFKTPTPLRSSQRLNKHSPLFLSPEVELKPFSLE